MTQLKMVASLLAIVALGTAAAGYTLQSKKSASTGVSQRVELADASLDSTTSERAEALRVLDQMIDLAATDRGVVAAAPFQWSALATIEWPLSHRFAPDPSDLNSYYEKLDLGRQAAQLKQRARALFARRSNRPGTDLLGGLLAASEYFASQPSGPRTLVLSSNMWAYSPSDGLNLKKRALSRPEISRLISRLAQSGRIARLSDVCVYVVGAGLDPGRRVTNLIQLSMRSFWQAYFARSGAVVRAWAPSLDSEPSC
jgi:hypothetical protein